MTRSQGPRTSESAGCSNSIGSTGGLGAVPNLKRAGRPRAPEASEREREVVKQAYGRFRMCAWYLEQVILFHYRVKINYLIRNKNQVHQRKTSPPAATGR